MAVEQISGAGEAGGEFRPFAGVAAPKPPRAVAKTVVPFREARRMSARADIRPARCPKARKSA